MASITNLAAVRRRLTEVPALMPVQFEPAPAGPDTDPGAAQQTPQAKEASAPAELYPHELVNIRVTRQCAEWLLLNVDKLRKRLRQSATDPNTRFKKKTKSSAALLLAIQASTAITDTLNTDTNDK